MTKHDQIDPRLLMLMEWLKENDETMESKREHANRDSKWVPEIIEDTDYD